MKGGVRKFGAAESGLLPEGRIAGPMPWVIAIMMFLTVLAAAAGLGLGGAASRLDEQIGSRVTIQVVEANPDVRHAQAAAAAAAIRNLPGVTNVRPVPDSEVQALLEPWLGAGGVDSDIPVPDLIDVDLTPEAHRGLDSLRQAVAAAAPAARIDDNGQWLAPLSSLIGALKWLAAGLVILMVAATAATVVLAARAALDTHRGTIEILHLMGATDVQVARLFQRRIALDALFGGVVGLVGAGLILLALPVAGVVLSMLVARTTILRALGRML